MIDFSLHYDSVWPFFLCIALLLGLAAMPVFRSADTAPDPHGRRLSTLDGLRGFLALAVVFHHAVIYHSLLEIGQWDLPASNFYRMLGPIGVSLFFMITGFLFWSQMLRSSGRPSWISLYVGRVYRIGPVYLATVLILFLEVACITHFRLRVHFNELLKPALEWMLLGAYKTYDLNGYANTGLLLANVTYTLRYEWFFYLSLPVLALFARNKRFHLGFVAVILLVCQAGIYARAAQVPELFFVRLFLLGMVIASLREAGLLVRLPDWLGSGLILMLLGSVATNRGPALYAVNCFMLMGVLYLVVCGVSIFGLLVSRPAIRLGDASYGIYLMQGLALGAVLRPKMDHRWAVQSALGFWVLVLVAAAGLVVVACAAHYWIEQPGIRMGKRVSAAWKARLAATH